MNDADIEAVKAHNTRLRAERDAALARAAELESALGKIQDLSSNHHIAAIARAALAKDDGE